MTSNRLHRRIRRTLAGTVCAVGLIAANGLSAQTASAKTDTLVFGVVPQQSASRLAQVWVPFLRHVSKKAGVAIAFATAKDIPTFEACLERSTYDLAYMNPYHYTEFHDAPGYVAFARQSGKQLKGLVVARKDSDVTTLHDLAGQTVAFPSPAAFGASVIPRAEMRSAGIAIQPRYVKSHDSVYRAVAAGLMPAGGGVGRTFSNIGKAIRDQLKVIYETKEYTPHAFAAHPRVPRQIVEAVRTAMTGIKQSNPALLKPLGMKGFEPAEDKDWNDVRSLNLTKKQTEISSKAAVRCRSD